MISLEFVEVELEEADVLSLSLFGDLFGFLGLRVFREVEFFDLDVIKVQF